MTNENSAREDFIEAVQQNPDTLNYALKELTKQNPIALKYASNELKNDRDVMLAALGLVKENGYSLESVPDEIKKNKKFMMLVDELKKNEKNFKLGRKIAISSIDELWELANTTKSEEEVVRNLVDLLSGFLSLTMIFISTFENKNDSKMLVEFAVHMFYKDLDDEKYK